MPVSYLVVDLLLSSEYFTAHMKRSPIIGVVNIKSINAINAINTDHFDSQSTL